MRREITLVFVFAFFDRVLFLLLLLLDLISFLRGKRCKTPGPNFSKRLSITTVFYSVNKKTELFILFLVLYLLLQCFLWQFKTYLRFQNIRSKHSVLTKSAIFPILWSPLIGYYITKLYYRIQTLCQQINSLLAKKLVWFW